MVLKHVTVLLVVEKTLRNVLSASPVVLVAFFILVDGDIEKQLTAVLLHRFLLQDIHCITVRCAFFLLDKFYRRLRSSA